MPGVHKFPRVRLAPRRIRRRAARNVEGFRHAVINAVKAWVPGKATGPFQPAIAAGLDLPDAYFTGLAAQLASQRDVLCAGLEAAGLDVFRPQGTYFVTVDIRPLRPDGDGMAFCRALPHDCGVVAVPN